MTELTQTFSAQAALYIFLANRLHSRNNMLFLQCTRRSRVLCFHFQLNQ